MATDNTLPVKTPLTSGTIEGGNAAVAVALSWIVVRVINLAFPDFLTGGGDLAVQTIVGGLFAASSKIVRKWLMARKLIPVILFCVLLSGCVTTHFEDEFWKADGSVTRITWTSTSAAAPFSKLDTSNQSMACSFGSGTIRTGQSAQGLDNTGQIEAFAAAIKAVLEMYLPAPPIP